nr:E2-Spy [synthetic construct]
MHHHHHHRLACKEDYRYAISSTDEIGLLGAGGLTTTWKEYNHDLQLNDGTVKASCVAGSFKVTALNVVSRRYLASLHKKALPTSVTFELLFDGTNPATEEMGDDFRSGLCPFDTSPVVKGKYNTALLNGAAFYLVCPIGWTGVIECTAVSPTTLRTEVVKTFRRDKPFPHRMDCVTTTVENEDLGSGGGGSGGGGSGSAHIVMVDAYKPTK